MRFNDRITFVKEAESYYDPVLGEYVEGEPIIKSKPCNVSTLGINRTNELFGQIDKAVTVARLQRPYNEPFDYVIIKDKKTNKEQKYNVMRQSNYRKGVFYLEGVFHG